MIDVQAQSGSGRSFSRPTIASSRAVSERQLIGSSGSAHDADHADTRNRCAGSVHESTGPNIRSWSANDSAHVQ